MLDPAFLGRELPSARSWLSLAIIGVGAVCYANFDAQFTTNGLAAYAWPSIYLSPASAVYILYRWRLLYFTQSRRQQLCGSIEHLSYSAGKSTLRGVRTR